MKIAVVYSSKSGMMDSFHKKNGGISEEEEFQPPPDLFAECDSDETIQAVISAIQDRYHVIPIESNENALDNLRRSKPDLVFNISERLYGPNRESHIPTICEILDIPFTGSDPLTLGICLDKSRAKEILSYYRIANPKFWIVESISDMPDIFEFPLIVKPLYEGSSKGIFNDSVIFDPDKFREKVGKVIKTYRQPVIIEKFLQGREFTVGVVGNDNDFEILPIVEINHSQLPAGAVPIYSYEAKWVWDTPENPLKIFQCPAEISEGLAGKISNLVRQTCRILKIRDWCRIDIRLDELDVPNILEINPLPGILPNPEDNSCLPKAARAAGYSYSALLYRVINSAKLRYGLLTPELIEKAAYR